jgi:hypothetical protein
MTFVQIPSIGFRIFGGVLKKAKPLHKNTWKLCALFNKILSTHEVRKLEYHDGTHTIKHLGMLLRSLFPYKSSLSDLKTPPLDNHIGVIKMQK